MSERGHAALRKLRSQESVGTAVSEKQRKSVVVDSMFHPQACSRPRAGSINSIIAGASNGALMSYEMGTVYKGRPKLIRGAPDDGDGWCMFYRNLLRMKASVFPAALQIAIPCALVAGVVRKGMDLQAVNLEEEYAPLHEVAAWSGFSWLMGFLIVFRTSQSYARFWEGCTATSRMRAEWFDACSALVAFCKHSRADPDIVLQFQNILIRLFSMLHASAMAAMEDGSSKALEDVEAFSFELIDAESLDEATLCAVRDADCKTELVLAWIQGLIVESMDTGVLTIPPPILSRAFQELANGCVAWHEAQKISSIPFPFPYKQTCDCLLVMHWLLSPVVTAHFVRPWWWAIIFSFVQVFILWCLNFIALEIENPFGMDDNDLDGREAQHEMNACLLALLEPEALRTPKLNDNAVLYGRDDVLSNGRLERAARSASFSRSFNEVWKDIGRKNSWDLESVQRSLRPSSLTENQRSSKSQDWPTPGNPDFLAAQISDAEARLEASYREAYKPRGPRADMGDRQGDAAPRTSASSSLQAPITEESAESCSHGSSRPNRTVGSERSLLLGSEVLQASSRSEGDIVVETLEHGSAQKPIVGGTPKVALVGRSESRELGNDSARNDQDCQV